jgi:uncharacterized protein (UPF0548 family)
MNRDRSADERLAGLTTAALTYAEVGATRRPLPAGYRHVERRAVIGRGQRVFESASDALLSWQMHLRAGLGVSSSAPTACPGTVVVLTAGVGPLRMRAPCRVIYDVHEGRRRGFAYGTLAGHPESGEEAFVVEHHEDDTVSLTITAFSRPGSWYARVGGPIARATQDWMTDRYVRALTSR